MIAIRRAVERHEEAGKAKKKFVQCSRLLWKVLLEAEIGCFDSKVAPPGRC